MKVGDYTNTRSIQFLLNHFNNLKRLTFLRLDLKDNPGIFNIDELLKKPKRKKKENERLFEAKCKRKQNYENDSYPISGLPGIQV